MESFWNDLHYEDIHFRDNLQFEVESDFAPIFALKENVSTQEFYFFIPSSLQINRSTYSKEQFYKDRTNLIRFKTPEFSFSELIDKNNALSPLNRINALKNMNETEHHVLLVQDELKLLSNVVRSALRSSVRQLLDCLGPPQSHVNDVLQTNTLALCKDILSFRKEFFHIQADFSNYWSGIVLQDFLYTDEFISGSIDYYLTGFLEYLRRSKIENIHEIDHHLCEIITEEKRHRQKYYRESGKSGPGPFIQERTLHRRGLLNKYVLDALLLGLERISWVEKYGGIIAGLATGVAMFFYAVLLFLNVTNLGFNSIPFLVLTVILYVLRDRFKEGLKTVFHQQACRWFSDYTTQIRTPNNEIQIGNLKEFFSFLTEEDLQEEIRQVRQKGFASDLQLFKQPEVIFYYKKEMVLVSSETPIRARRHKLHNIFLFNIHLLLEKASNPVEPHLNLDIDTMEIGVNRLPKVYYINIIVKNTFIQPDLQVKVEIKKFCVVIDKNGIRRVETVHG